MDLKLVAATIKEIDFFEILCKVKNHPSALVSSSWMSTVYDLKFAKSQCDISLPSITVIWQSGVITMHWYNKSGQQSNVDGAAEIEWDPTRLMIFKDYYVDGVKLSST